MEAEIVGEGELGAFLRENGFDSETGARPPRRLTSFEIAAQQEAKSSLACAAAAASQPALRHPEHTSPAQPPHLRAHRRRAASPTRSSLRSMGLLASPRDALILALGSEASPSEGRRHSPPTTPLAGGGPGGVGQRRRTKSDRDVVLGRGYSSPDAATSPPQRHAGRVVGLKQQPMPATERTTERALPAVTAGGASGGCGGAGVEWSSTCTSTCSSSRSPPPPGQQQQQPTPTPPAAASGQAAMTTRHTVPIPPTASAANGGGGPGCTAGSPPSAGSASPSSSPVSRGARLRAKSADDFAGTGGYRQQQQPPPHLTPSSPEQTGATCSSVASQEPLTFERRPIRRATMSSIVTAAEAFAEAGAHAAYAAAPRVPLSAGLRPPLCTHAALRRRRPSLMAPRARPIRPLSSPPPLSPFSPLALTPLRPIDAPAKRAPAHHPPTAHQPRAQAAEARQPRRDIE